MKVTIVSVVLFIAALIGCKSTNVDSEMSGNNLEKSSQSKTRPEDIELIRKIIEGNTIKSNLSEKSARISGNSIWYFSEYGYKYTSSGSSSYDNRVSVYVSNGNNFPITLTISGQLVISDPIFSASTSGCYVYGDEVGKNIVLGPGNNATYSFIASVKNGSVEGYLSLSQTEPFTVTPAYTDDYFYLIKHL